MAVFLTNLVNSFLFVLSQTSFMKSQLLFFFANTREIPCSFSIQNTLGILGLPYTVIMSCVARQFSFFFFFYIHMLFFMVACKTTMTVPPQKTFVNTLLMYAACVCQIRHRSSYLGKCGQGLCERAVLLWE